MRNLAARSAMFGGIDTTPPWDYAVEYLQSNGTAYIDADLQFYGGETFDIECDCQITVGNGFVGLFGFYYAVIKQKPTVSQLRPYYRTLSLASMMQLTSIISSPLPYSFPQSNTLLSRHLLKISNNNVFVDGVLSLTGGVTDSGVVNCSDTRYAKFYVFCSSSNGNTDNKDCLPEHQDGTRRIWTFKASIDGVAKRNLVPCVKDDEPCMYDYVSKEFFYNIGTGQFTAGPRIT